MHLRRLPAALAPLAGLPRRDERERELAEELETHLQLQTEDNLRAGMSPQEARRQLANAEIANVGDPAAFRSALASFWAWVLHHATYVALKRATGEPGRPVR